MHCFLIVAQSDSDLTVQEISQVFPEFHEIVKNHVWVVGHNTYMSTDAVCIALGIYPGEPPHNTTGIVLKINESSGYIDKTIWEKLAYWEAL